MEENKREKVAWQFLELVFVIVMAAALAFGLQTFLIKPYKIPSESMKPTLEVGQRIIVDRLSDSWRDPQLGDIVVFYPPVSAQNNRCANESQGPGKEQACAAVNKEVDKRITYIKRIVGMPGDKIKFTGGRVIRNGKPLVEPYYKISCRGEYGCEFEQEITIPEGHYYMVGDNRGNSLDSRFWGAVPGSAITGRAFVSYWPIKEIGAL